MAYAVLAAFAAGFLVARYSKARKVGIYMLAAFGALAGIVMLLTL